MKLMECVPNFSEGRDHAVLDAIAKQYPKWSIYKDVYGITYNQKTGAKKTYKVTLLNKDKKINVKLDENGNFL